MGKFKKWIDKELLETKVLLRNIPAWVMTMFVLSVILMNLLANKSIDTGSLTWLALDSGIVISWMSFLIMDIVVKRFGTKASTKLSIIALIINFFISIIFMTIALIPGYWGESFNGPTEVINNALNNTFKGSWYIVVASSIIFLISSIVNGILNTTVGAMFKKNPNGKLAFISRSYISTMVAQFVDNLLFALIVSLNFFGWSLIQCFTCALTGAIVELICEIMFSPIRYKLSKKWDKQNIGKEYLELVGE